MMKTKGFLIPCSTFGVAGCCSPPRAKTVPSLLANIIVITTDQGKCMRSSLRYHPNFQEIKLLPPQKEPESCEQCGGTWEGWSCSRSGIGLQACCRACR